MANLIRYRNLPKAPAPGVYLHCIECQESYSANASDYFLANPADVVECGMCDEPLKLVRKMTQYVKVR